MICEDARRHIGAEPYAISAELAEHLQSCSGCAAFQLEMVALETDIRRALQESPISSRARRPKRLVTRTRWALAASVVLAVLATLAVWALRPADTLAHEVVAHVTEEPESWAGGDAVSAPELEGILGKSGLVLGATSYSVVYARSCWFRGHYVPHLVVRTSHGLVTVLILRNVTISTREAFNEDGLTGVIVPAPQGSIAVLARDSSEIASVAEQMEHAVRSQSNLR